jgi:hypothetical protein
VASTPDCSTRTFVLCWRKVQKGDRAESNRRCSGSQPESWTSTGRPQSVQWESNPHDLHGKQIGCRYIMHAELAPFRSEWSWVDSNHRSSPRDGAAVAAGPQDHLFDGTRAVSRHAPKDSNPDQLGWNQSCCQLHQGRVSSAEGEGLEPPSGPCRRLFSRQVPHPAGCLPTTSCGGWNRTNIKAFRAPRPTVRRPRIVCFLQTRVSAGKFGEKVSNLRFLVQSQVASR